MAQFVTIAGRAVNIDYISYMRFEDTVEDKTVYISLADSESWFQVSQEKYPEDYKALLELREMLPPITSLIAQRAFFPKI